MSRGWAGGSTRAWRRVRAQVLADNRARNGGRCTVALPGVCTGTADQVHHVAGRAVTGDDPRYLAASCAACNATIGDPVGRDPAPVPRTDWTGTAGPSGTAWDDDTDDAVTCDDATGGAEDGRAGAVFPTAPPPGHPSNCPFSPPGAGAPPAAASGGIAAGHGPDRLPVERAGGARRARGGSRRG